MEGLINWLNNLGIGNYATRTSLSDCNTKDVSINVTHRVTMCYFVLLFVFYFLFWKSCKGFLLLYYWELWVIHVLVSQKCLNIIYNFTIPLHIKLWDKKTYHDCYNLPTIIKTLPRCNPTPNCAKIYDLNSMMMLLHVVINELNNKGQILYMWSSCGIKKETLLAKHHVTFHTIEIHR